MEVSVTKHNRGFTLVEILISMLLLTLVLLMVVQTLGTYIRHNVDNLIRDEAVKIAQSCIENLRNGIDCESTVTKSFRNFSLNFNVTVNSTNNEVKVIVSYKYPPNSNSTKTYSLNTVVHSP